LKAKSKAESLTMYHLLKDPIYKKWIMTPPKMNSVGTTNPWRVFVQKKEGGWARVDFPSYAKAFNWMKNNLKNYEDATIHCKRTRFKPPVVKYRGKKQYWPCPPGYRWCGYCRRPTKFLYFKRHHNQPIIVSYYKRCHICGVRGEGLPTYDTRVPNQIFLG
jgi:hypothetical protein